MKNHLPVLLSALCVLALSVGCGSSEPTPSERNTEALNRLPEEDRQAAIRQWNCVVCNNLLAEKGLPKKSMKTGEAVFCCDDECLAEFEKNPRKYQAFLSQ